MNYSLVKLLSLLSGLSGKSQYLYFIFLYLHILSAKLNFYFLSLALITILPNKKSISQAIKLFIFNQQFLHLYKDSQYFVSNKECEECNAILAVVDDVGPFHHYYRVLLWSILS